MCEVENRAHQKFEAALFRRRLQSNLCHDATTHDRTGADQEAAALVASMARNARRDSMAEIAEIRRQAEDGFAL